MITYEWLYQLLAAATYILLRWRYGESAFSLQKTGMDICLLLYTVYCVGVFFFPIMFDRSLFEEQSPAAVNLVPMKSLLAIIHHGTPYAACRQILGNVAIFIPFGLTALRFKRLSAFPSYAAALCITTLSVETIQLCINLITGVPNRRFDVDDLMLNILGGLLGYCLFRTAKQLYHRKCAVKKPRP